jgi:hypothetical protein
MLKYTDQSHVDFQQIPKALEHIKSTMAKINEGMTNDDFQNAKKMIQIEKSVDGDFEPIVHPKRKYLREGSFYVRIAASLRDAKDNKRTKLFNKKDPHYWFLFDDVLVHVEPKKSPKDEKLFDCILRK